MTGSANTFSAQGMQTVVVASPDDALRATFVPAAGMLCGSLRFRGHELLAQRRGVRAYAERGSTMGIPLLHPWANRLAGFGYETADRVVEFDRESALMAHDQNGLPIHGVIPGLLPWQLLDREDGAAHLRARMDWERGELLSVFPFPHTLELDATVTDSTLTVETTLRAASTAAVPVSFGYHPYLTIPETDRTDWQVRLPAATQLLLDDRMIPTGAGEPLAARCVDLGESGWDDAFGELAPTPRFSVSANGRTISLEFLRGYDFAQVFAQPEQSFVCFEPMTAPTNALVSGDRLRLVEPGAEFRAAFQVSIAAWR
ncbi:MAG: aldose epimerase family protein [Solirubrobacteraceae bacterium]